MAVIHADERLGRLEHLDDSNRGQQLLEERRSFAFGRGHPRRRLCGHEPGHDKAGSTDKGDPKVSVVRSWRREGDATCTYMRPAKGRMEKRTPPTRGAAEKETVTPQMRPETDQRMKPSFSPQPILTISRSRFKREATSPGPICSK